MRVLVLTIGSRGDIQPFIALGQGLKAAGHDVFLCTATSFEAFVRENGLDYAPMTDVLIKLTETDAGKVAFEGGGGSKLELMSKAKPAIRQMFDDAWQAVQDVDPDIIVYHPKTLAPYHIAEKLHIPIVLSLGIPLYTPTGAFPMPVLPLPSMGAWLNRLSYSILRFMTAPYSDVINDWRVSHGLPQRGMFASEANLPFGDHAPVPVVYHYSHYVVPVPTDFPPSVDVAGYWFVNPTPSDSGELWVPPSDLVQWLDAGSPPVYVGFGSMLSQDAEAKSKLVLEAIALSGERGIIARGWGGLKLENPTSPSIFVLDEAPHDWLFPRMACVVHHGGAGTTAAGLRAGVPTIICPFFGDQPFWGARVAALGVGTQPIPQAKLTAEELAEAIREAVGDEAMRARAAELGEKIRSEDGVGRAVASLERLQRRTGSPRRTDQLA